MVRIGLVDTGIDPTNPYLRGVSVVAWKDFATGSPTPFDDDGHGTMVAWHMKRIVNALAPNEPVELEVAKVCGPDMLTGGYTCTFNAIRDALDWMTTRKTASATNISLGTLIPFPSDINVLPGNQGLVQKSFRAAYNAGIIPVVANGNGIGNVGLIPEPGFLGAFSDQAFAISAGWPSIGSSWNPDVVEDSDDGSSFSAPQITAKVALLNQTVRNPDIVWEALMSTAEPNGSEIPYQRPPWQQGAYTPILGDWCNLFKPNYPQEYQLCNQMMHQLSDAVYFNQVCQVPGKCGWGYPRFYKALDYISKRRTLWFQAGRIPANNGDQRYLGWAPGYAYRSLQALYADTPGTRIPPSPGFGLQSCDLRITGNTIVHDPVLQKTIQIVTGTGIVNLNTPVGAAHVAGTTPPLNQAYARLTNEFSIGADAFPISGVWLADGTFVILYAGDSATAFGLGTQIRHVFLNTPFESQMCSVPVD